MFNSRGIHTQPYTDPITGQKTDICLYYINSDEWTINPIGPHEEQLRFINLILPDSSALYIKKVNLLGFKLNSAKPLPARFLAYLEQIGAHVRKTTYQGIPVYELSNFKLDLRIISKYRFAWAPNSIQFHLLHANYLRRHYGKVFNNFSQKLVDKMMIPLESCFFLLEYNVPKIINAVMRHCQTMGRSLKRIVNKIRTFYQYYRGHTAAGHSQKLVLPEATSAGSQISQAHDLPTNSSLEMTNPELAGSYPLIETRADHKYFTQEFEDYYKAQPSETRWHGSFFTAYKKTVVKYSLIFPVADKSQGATQMRGDYDTNGLIEILLLSFSPRQDGEQIWEDERHLNIDLNYGPYNLKYEFKSFDQILKFIEELKRLDASHRHQPVSLNEPSRVRIR